MAAETNKPRITVEIDIFSGRPNPSWSVTGADAVAIWSAVSATALAPGGPCGARIPDLGFRGFLIRNPQDPRNPVFRVFHDHVCDDHGHALENRQLARQILSTAPPEITSEVGPLLPRPKD